MTRIVTVALLAVVLVSAWPASAVPERFDLTGRDIINTRGFPCGDGEFRYLSWVNDTGVAVYVRRVQVWYGMYAGAVSDFYAWVQREPGGYVPDGSPDPRISILAHGNWDHYADPTNLNVMAVDYAPDYISILPGEQVTLYYGCSNMNDPPREIHAQVIVTVWYGTP